MLKYALLFLFFTVSLSKRLIAFNESYSVWMSNAEVLRLESNSHNFIDITDYQVPTIKKFQVDPLPTKLTRQKLVNELLQELEADNLRDTVSQLGEFYTRYYNSATGKQAAEWIFAQYEEYAANRDDIEVEYFVHSFQMPSVIARIKGAGNDRGATRIILGGHEDSVGRTSTGRSPGADDDASGTSTVFGSI